jgi:hypothetical protein
MVESKLDIEVKIAQNTCKVLENQYRESVIGGMDVKKTIKILEAFENEVFRILENI